MAVYPALPGAAEARIRATRELLLAAESGESRVDPDLEEVFRTYRRMADHTQKVFAQRIKRAERDSRERSRVERELFDVVWTLAALAEQITDGSSDLELPTDLRVFLRLKTGPSHYVVFRSVTADTYTCHPRSKPVADFLASLPDASVPPPSLRSRQKHLISILDIPRSYRRAMLTHLVMLGHEVAHIEDWFTGISTVNQVVAQTLPLNQFPKERSKALIALCYSWSREISADLYCVRRLGPAGLLVFAEYGRVAGVFLGENSLRRKGKSKHPERSFLQHPPGEARIALMLEELRALGYRVGVEPLDGPYAEVIDGWQKVADSTAEVLAPLPVEFSEAYGFIREHVLGRLQRLVRRRIPDRFAYVPDRLRYARTLAQDLTQGIALSERVEANGKRTLLEVEDLYNAAAYVRFVSLDELAKKVPQREHLSQEERRGAALETLDMLLARAIEGVRIGLEWGVAVAAQQGRR